MTRSILLLAPMAGALLAADVGKPEVPRIWSDQELSTWSTPVAGVNATPNFVTEEEYYRTPVDNLRTYPVYHPDREPKGYAAWLKQQVPKPLIEPAKLKTEKDWLEAGRRVFDELDVPIFRTSDSRALQYIRDREALRKDRTTVTKDGILPAFRWVVDRSGQVKLSAVECAGCHLRVMADGTVIRGAQGNLDGGGPVLEIMFGQVNKELGKNGKPMPSGELNYRFFAVPWIKDDIHLKLKTMSEEASGALQATVIPGTFARFNGSIYYTTKMPDLIGVKERRYLDHTGTHLNRGPADIARYGVLVSTTDDGSIGSYKFFDEHQRRVILGSYRFSDETMWALGKYIYSLEPPPNPNQADAVASRGKKVFDSAGCAMCHTPPLYTNNMLIPVAGFRPASDHPATQRLHVMQGVSIDTDPDLALKTRKGTGYYKVPSLKGLWYRGLIEHSGSIASLEEWFDSKRLRDDYVPSGWKGPGVKTRAVRGHEFGLSLNAEDKRALIRFLRTL